nr:hypothetical protein [Tanacetum cinerariifolium]
MCALRGELTTKSSRVELTTSLHERNKADFDTMSMDDLYNNLKVTNGINIAQAINTAHGVSTASTQVNAVYSTNIDNLSDAVICAFIASQPNSPQLVHEDLQQIHPGDMEEMDSRWQMAMLTMRAIRKWRAPRNQDNKNKEGSKRSVPMETSTSITWVSCDGLDGYEWSDQAEERPNYALMAFLSSSSDSKIVDNCKKGLGYENYNAIPPPYTGNFMPQTLDLSFTSLDEFVNEPVVENCKAISSEEEPKVVRKYDDAPNYEEIDGGYVAFEGNPKGGKITGKCTIKTGKFNGKADEGFFVGYYLNSKAFRVFNSRTRIMEENLHIRFSESIPNVVGSGPDWLFDINALTRTINYEPIIASTQANGFADSKSSHNDGSKPSSDDGKKVDEDLRKESECKDQEKEDNVNSTNNVNTASNVNTVSLAVNAACINEVNVVGEKISIELLFDPKMPALEDDSIFDFSSDYEDDGAVADMNNLDTTIQVSHIPTTRIHKDHPLDRVIGDLQSATQTRKMSKNLEEHGFEEPKKVIHVLKDLSWIKAMQQELLQFKLQEVWTLVDLPNGKRVIGSKWVFKNKKDEIGIVIKNKARLVAQRYTQEEGIDYDEVYVCQPPGFEDPGFPDRVYKVEKALYGLHQAPRAWYETLSTYMLDNGFQRGKIDKTLFIKRHKEVKTASTQMETQKPLLKDEDGDKVDVHMYRSMIGSLMYLTSLRPDILFVVCACAIYQVNLK